MNKTYAVIYYHPTFGDNTFYFSSEQDAIEYTANWLAMDRAISLEAVESLTVVIN